MPERPSFINTAGQRRALDDDAPDSAIVEHYRRVFASRFVYEGFPDDMPDGWPELCLFDIGAVGCKDTGIGRVVLPASGYVLNVYGRPLEWVPSEVYGAGQNLPGDLMEPSDAPALWTDGAVYSIIEPWLQTISIALLNLNVNITAMSTPVLVAGLSGLELKAYSDIKSLKSGERYLPHTPEYGGQISVLDLKVTDHTQALVNTIRAADAQILTEFGIMNAGTGRESGVTGMETGSIAQELSLVMRRELALREDWCRRLSDFFGQTFSVRIADEWLEYMQSPQDMMQQEAEDDAGAEDRGSE